MDLEHFSRALKLRWLWFQWSDPDCPWVGTDVPCNEINNQFFRVSTRVIVGDGHTALSWQSPWLAGQAPKDLTPNLYKLAWRKNNIVAEDIANQNWLRRLWLMPSAQEMAKFINMRDLVQDVQLTDVADSITWWWTAHGTHKAKSAYAVQFKRAFCTFNSKAIWRVQTKGKHCVFA